jgi:hypothetical protein
MQTGLLLASLAVLGAAASTAAARGGGAADLSGTWTSARARCRGEECRIRATLEVRNRGGERAGRTAVRIYLSSDDHLGIDDPLLLIEEFGGLRPRQRRTLQLKGELPAGTDPHGRQLIAVIDADGDVEEGDEENNLVVSGALR